MPLTGYHAFQERLKSYTLGSWPHPASFGVTPQSLSEAGFFHNPAFDAPDSATCFLCDKSLDGWTENDVALDEHIEHTIKRGGVKKGCPFALLRAGPHKLLQLGLVENKQLVKMRKDTFGTKKSKWWPAHRPSLESMAAAGFYFTADQLGGDGVTCCWCELSLDGWTQDDDPLQEHRDRSPRCYFFTNVLLPAQTQDNQTDLDEWEDLAGSQPVKKATSKKKTPSAAATKRTKKAPGDRATSPIEIDTSVEYQSQPAAGTMSRSIRTTRLKSLAAASLGHEQPLPPTAPGRTTRSGRTVSTAEQAPHSEPPAMPKKFHGTRNEPGDSIQVEAIEPTVKSAPPAIKRPTATKGKGKKKAIPGSSDEELEVQTVKPPQPRAKPEELPKPIEEMPAPSSDVEMEDAVEDQVVENSVIEHSLQGDTLPEAEPLRDVSIQEKELPPPVEMPSGLTEIAGAASNTFMTQDLDSSQSNIIPIPSTQDLSIIEEEESLRAGGSPTKGKLPPPPTKTHPSPLKQSVTVSDDETEMAEADATPAPEADEDVGPDPVVDQDVNMDASEAMPTLAELVLKRFSPKPAAPPPVPLPGPSRRLPPPEATVRPASPASQRKELTTNMRERLRSPESRDRLRSPEPRGRLRSPEPITRLRTPEPRERMRSPEPRERLRSPELWDRPQSPPPRPATPSKLPTPSRPPPRARSPQKPVPAPPAAEPVPVQPPNPTEAPRPAPTLDAAPPPPLVPIQAPAPAFQDPSITEEERGMSLKAWMAKLIEEEVAQTEAKLRQRLVDFDTAAAAGRAKLIEMGQGI